MIKGIYFKNVLKTVTTHTGTKVEYAIKAKDALKIDVRTYSCLLKEGIGLPWGIGFQKAKIITFAENSPMKKLGIDQALLCLGKSPKDKMLSFWQKDKCIKSMSSNKATNDIKNYLKVIKDLIDSGFKLPNITQK